MRLVANTFMPRRRERVKRLASIGSKHVSSAATKRLVGSNRVVKMYQSAPFAHAMAAIPQSAALHEQHRYDK